MSADILLGTVTVLMTVLGTIISLHAPTDRGWKIFYAVMFIVLGVIAVKFVIQQSRETAIANASLASDVGRLSASTDEISRMTTLNTQLQGRLLEQSDKIESLSQQGVDQATGGDSYAVVSPIMIPVVQPNTFALSLHVGKNSGKNSVLDAHVYLRQLPIPNEGKQSQFMDVLSGKGDPPVYVGQIDPNWSQTLSARITPFVTGTTSYVVNVFAKNKPTTETLQVRRNADGAWEYSYKIIRETTTGGPNKRGKYKTLEVTSPTWLQTVFIESK
jgi:hypothetical protein